MTEASDNDDLFGSDASSEGEAVPVNTLPKSDALPSDNQLTGTDDLDLFGESDDEVITRRAVDVQDVDKDQEEGQSATGAEDDVFGCSLLWSTEGCNLIAH